MNIQQKAWVAPSHFLALDGRSTYQEYVISDPPCLVKIKILNQSNLVSPMSTVTLVAVSHIFDSANNWLGYEYTEQISQHHTRILRYDSNGKEVSSRHVFSNIPHGDDVSEFIEFMTSAKSLAFNDNVLRQAQEHRNKIITE